MKKISILSIFIFIIGLCTCISCGYFISSAVLSSFSYGTSVVVQSQKFYAISILKANEKSELEKHIANLQSKNGAGFIYENHEEFHLVASIYENINDAELVKNNLKTSGIQAEIVEINTQNNEIKGSFSTEEKEIITEAIKSVAEAYKKLYDVSVSLDTSICDKAGAKLECNKAYSSIMTKMANLNSFFKENNSQVTSLKNRLEKISILLSCLNSEEYTTNSQTFSSLIKETYCKILLNCN